MPAIDFPNSPSVNDTHTVNNRIWKWNGTTWDVLRSSVPYSTGATGPTGATGNTGATGLTGATGATGLLSNGTIAGNTPYWNGTSWITNSSNIFNNGGNVGIGTTSPSSTYSLTNALNGNL